VGRRVAPGQIGVASLARMLETEFGTASRVELSSRFRRLGFFTGYALEREVELQTLCDPAIRHALAAHEIQLVSYHDLGRLQAAVAA